VCKDTNDVNRKALEVAQDTRRRHNAFLQERGAVVTPGGPEMAEVLAVNLVMPPCEDAMLQGYPFTSFGPPHAPRNRTSAANEIASEASLGYDDSNDHGGDSCEDEESE
jgi:hypothetical protein